METKIDITKFEKDFMDACVEAKKWTANRSQGYSIVVFEKGKIWVESFYTNNESHLKPTYIILASFNAWNTSDDELYNMYNPEGEEKKGFLWNTVEGQWEDKDEAKKYIIDEACGCYSGIDVVFAEQFVNAKKEMILEGYSFE